MTRVRTQKTDEPGPGSLSHWFWCPGCEDTHRITTPPWVQTGPESFEPSILVGGNQWPADSDFYKPTHAQVAPGEEIRCHSFLREGVWEFLNDSTHALAGQRVEMIDLPGYFDV